MSKLEQAAKQLLEHWDTPLWKQTEMTGTYINALREALVEQAEQKPMALSICLEKEVLALKHNVVGSHEYTQGRWDLLGEVQDVIRKHALPVIDTCDFGHKFAKLPDHPKKDGKARCPNCLAIGLDAARALETAAPVRTKDLTDDEIHKALHGKNTPPGLMNGIRAVIAADRELNK